MEEITRLNLSDVRMESGYKCNNTSGTTAVNLALNKNEFNYRHSSSGGIIIDNGKDHSGDRLVLLCP